MVDLSAERQVRFQYDGFINIRNLSREGFGRYIDIQSFKLSVGYFYNNLPYGKQIVYKQQPYGEIGKIKEGYFKLDWNDYVEEQFHKSDIDLASNFGPHSYMDLSEESINKTL